MHEVLTKDTAYSYLQKFFQDNPNPLVLFGTGTSCAVSTDFGMGALKDHLLAEIAKRTLTTAQNNQWQLLIDDLSKNNDLESAMNAIQDKDLIKMIVNSTASLIIDLDQKYGPSILKGDSCWPALILFQRMVGGLSPTKPHLHVATTNYDMLAEYAFEKENILYLTGFVGGLFCHRDWKRAKNSIVCYERTSSGSRGKKSQPKCIHPRHIRLHKVHGSLNMFKVNNEIIENNTYMYMQDCDFERIMITPGMSKYEILHQHRKELLGEYDQAVLDHNAFLFIGFGFNDEQLINQAILNKLIEQKCPGLIITLGSNPRIEDCMKKCPNLWLVCKKPDGNGTRICNSNYQDFIIDNINLWEPEVFTSEILGR